MILSAVLAHAKPVSLILNEHLLCAMFAEGLLQLVAPSAHGSYARWVHVDL